MRVIAGVARGRRLVGPPSGAATRPTSDKVRQALFNIVNDVVSEARVLEIFAGTGALSVEALSRGARSAMLIECDAGLCSIAKKNLETAGFTSQAQVLCRDVRRCGAQLQGQSFDLVLLDPPYGKDLEREALSVLSQSGVLLPTTVVVLEHATRDSGSLPGEWTFTRSYVYGDTTLSLLEHTSMRETATELPP